MKNLGFHFTAGIVLIKFEFYFDIILGFPEQLLLYCL